MPTKYEAKRWGVNVFFTVLAILFWVGSYRLISQNPVPSPSGEQHERGHFYGEVLKDLGVVVFGLALLDMLWSVFGGDPLRRDLNHLLSSVRLIDQSQKCGLIDVASNPEKIDMTDPVDAIKAAKRSIDMCGFTLHALYSKGRLKENLQIALRNKVKVRICIASPTNDDVLKNCLPEVAKAMPGQSEAVLRYLVDLKKELRSQNEGEIADRLSIYELHHGFMTASIMRRDGLMLVVPYLRYIFTLGSPAYLLVGSGTSPLFDSYQKEFDYIVATARELDGKAIKESPH
jgi:hypothetical protein